MAAFPFLFCLCVFLSSPAESGGATAGDEPPGAEEDDSGPPEPSDEGADGAPRTNGQ